MALRHEHANASYPVGLLRSRRDGPSSRDAAQNSQEGSPLHSCPPTRCSQAREDRLSGFHQLRSSFVRCDRMVWRTSISPCCQWVHHSRSTLTYRHSGGQPRQRSNSARSGREQPQRRQALLDYLVSAHQQRVRDCEAERSRCLQIDHQLELGRPLDWQCARVGARQNASDIAAARA